ncbi:MAG: DNA polymerase III subunit alpha [Chloroflexota bacterium]|nr:DNA polymerase III subunit alpha [Chloroflexota bacterium]
MFTHLHTHTEYSMLDGISRIPDLVYQVRDMGMESLAITDHGNLYGVVDFYSECKEAGIKPIIGCEVYVAHRSRHDRNASERSPYHLVLLARDNVGYRNLMQLVTKAHLEGFHYRPRIDWELLEQYHQGLICLSGCASAEVPRLIGNGQPDEARSKILQCRELFGEGYFLELQRHEHVEQLPAINEALTRMGKELGIPMVVTNDAHYVRKHEAPYQDLYICIQTNTTVRDEKRLRMEDDSYYVKTPAEMQALFSDNPEALRNTQLIADMCHVELGFGQTHLPKYPTPNDMPADEYLAQLCWEGFRRRYPRPTPEAEERLKYELEVIRHTQFGNYFLVVWDICDFVHRNQIMFGVRGSAAASVALYCLGITDVDPLEYRLVFERFLNLERKEMPDIDMDFQDDRRDEVLHYVIDRYGSDRVAQIITFGTMGAKAALRDVGRSLGMSYGDVDRIARMVPFKSRTLEDALRVNPEFVNTYEADNAVHDLVDNAKGLEGIVHHVSTHAAGVLIADEPLTETVPLQRPTRGDENSPVLMTQYSMDPVAKLGLLKMDFLGLTNLTILDRATKLLDETQGIKIDLSRLALDDKETFDLLSSGKTTDLFQLESAGMQRYIKELKPSNLGDIAAMIALYRPGPMEHIDTFIDAKHGRTPITYPHPSLQELLDETYGVIVYQDQVLLILQRFAGYTLGEADTVRKAMGKKISSLMAEERDRFIDGALGKGFDRPLATQVFDLIEPFAGYAFNKAHSVSYALISYWTAYFKAHYPLEYMCSVLNSRLDNTDRIVSSINECSKLQIPVLLPDINRSGEFFTIDKESGAVPSLRFGLAAVKTVGEGAVRPLVAERQENGPFESIDDFCRRADMSGLNRRTLESLVRAGAFDTLGSRGAVASALDQIVATAQLETRTRNSGQTSLFGGMDQANAPQMTGISLNALDVSNEEKAAWEKELLGVSLSYNPLMALAGADVGEGINSIDQLDEDMQGLTYTLVGHVASVTERYTREQKKFLVVNYDLLGGQVEIIVWPDVLERTAEMWAAGRLLKTTGKLRLRGDGYSLACEQVSDFVPQASSAGEVAEATVQAIRETSAPAKPGNGQSDNGNGSAAGTPRRNGGNGSTRHQANGSYRTGPNGNGNGNGRGGSNWPGSGAAATASMTNARTVFLGISESDDPIEDAHLLREVISMLLEYPGKDRVNLEIYTEGRRVVMDLPVVSTGYCDEMRQRLESLLGANSVLLQGSDGPDVDDVPF